jgi:hypothetical protein
VRGSGAPGARERRMRTSFLWAVVLCAGTLPACGSTGDGSPPSGHGCTSSSCAAPADGGSSDASTGEGGGSPVDGPQTCHTNADCTSPFDFECVGGSVTLGCGAVMPPQYPCNVDPDCQLIDGAAPPKPMVCGQPAGCVDGQGCIPACQSDSDCGGEIVCRSGHCVARPCQVDSDCPSIGITDFVCAGTSGSQACALKGCASDSDCHGGFCVNHTCTSQLGVCESPPS